MPPPLDGFPTRVIVFLGLFAANPASKIADEKVASGATKRLAVLESPGDCAG
jgi:hypothetical protein